MTCCGERTISRYVDGELSPTEREEVNVHLRGCRHCAAEVTRVRQMDDILRTWGAQRAPLPASADFRIRQEVRERRDKRKVRGLYAFGRMAPAAVGSSIAAVLVLLSVNLHGVYPSRSAAETAWAIQQSSIKRQAAPLLQARRSSAILGGQPKVEIRTLGRHPNSSVLS